MNTIATLIKKKFSSKLKSPIYYDKTKNNTENNVLFTEMFFLYPIPPPLFFGSHFKFVSL